MPRPPSYRDRYANMLASQGEIAPYEPSFAERIGYGIRQLGGEQKLQDFEKLGGFIPGVGEAMDVDAVKRYAEAGNLTDAGITAAMAVLPGSAVKAKDVVKRGIKKAADRAELTSVAKRVGDLVIPESWRGPVSYLLGGHETTTPGRILNEIDKGGYSVHVPTGEVPTEGLFSGIYRNEDARTVVRPSGTPMTRNDVINFNRRNARKLSEGLDTYLGGWKEDATGDKFLDVSRRFPENQLRQATKFAERTNQKKIFRRSDYAELPVGSWRDFIKGDVYKQRLMNAYEHGSKYMAGKTPWWELPVFEEIYGKENMQKVKGLLAATSSNTAPPPNVQAATEYLRRLMAGEPMVQPNWRAPQNVMGGFAKPGGVMPMERGGRRHNLQAAVEERPLSGEVVREKMDAMSGDPNAVVLDRVHVYPTEDPATGVYATGQRGKGPDEGPLREEWRNIVRGLARSIGIDPNTFGAQVWAGLRELGGRPLGASYGYNDIAVDFIQKKAAHLGISIEQMKQLMREGKGELLVKALGIPVAAAAGYGAVSQQEQQPPP